MMVRFLLDLHLLQARLRLDTRFVNLQPGAGTVGILELYPSVYVHLQPHLLYYWTPSLSGGLVWLPLKRVCRAALSGSRWTTVARVDIQPLLATVGPEKWVLRERFGGTRSAQITPNSIQGGPFISLGRKRITCRRCYDICLLNPGKYYSVFHLSRDNPFRIRSWIYLF